MTRRKIVMDMVKLCGCDFDEAAIILELNSFVLENALMEFNGECHSIQANALFEGSRIAMDTWEQEHLNTEQEKLQKKSAEPVEVDLFCDRKSILFKVLKIIINRARIVLFVERRFLF